MPAHKVPPARRSRVPRGSAMTLLPPPADPPSTQTLGPPMAAPSAPIGLSKANLADWRTFWESPQAAHVLPSHVPALRRLFLDRERRDRYLKEGQKSTVVYGSTGQPVLHPLIKEANALSTSILALEDRFGLSPKHSIVMSGEFDDATGAAARANAALAAGFEPPAAKPAAKPKPKPVRRLAAVE